jgi:hypothetical protein
LRSTFCFRFSTLARSLKNPPARTSPSNSPNRARPCPPAFGWLARGRGAQGPRADRPWREGRQNCRPGQRCAAPAHPCADPAQPAVAEGPDEGLCGRADPCVSRQPASTGVDGRKELPKLGGNRRGRSGVCKPPKLRTRGLFLHFLSDRAVDYDSWASGSPWKAVASAAGGIRRRLRERRGKRNASGRRWGVADG